MLFKSHSFKVLSTEKYYKHKFENGINDETIKNSQILSYSPMIKPENKEEISEKEFIYSYLKAAEIIAEKCEITNPAIKMVINEYSLALPSIFCCRLAIELSLKKCLKEYDVKYKYTHHIIELWKSLKSEFEKHNLTYRDVECIEDMDKFIRIICYLDNDNSTALRYPNAKDGVQEQNQLSIVYIKQIVSTTRSFVEQLLN